MDDGGDRTWESNQDFTGCELLGMAVFLGRGVLEFDGNLGGLSAVAGTGVGDASFDPLPSLLGFRGWY